jgi:hypothetical protein
MSTVVFGSFVDIHQLSITNGPLISGESLAANDSNGQVNQTGFKMGLKRH